jgi:hypothetical protein
VIITSIITFFIFIIPIIIMPLPRTLEESI